MDLTVSAAFGHYFHGDFLHGLVLEHVERKPAILLYQCGRRDEQTRLGRIVRLSDWCKRYIGAHFREDAIVKLDEADFGKHRALGPIGRRHDLFDRRGVAFALHRVQGGM